VGPRCRFPWLMLQHRESVGKILLALEHLGTGFQTSMMGGQPARAGQGSHTVGRYPAQVDMILQECFTSRRRHLRLSPATAVSPTGWSSRACSTGGRGAAASCTGATALKRPAQRTA
jgi:hypothetical protein